VKLEVAVAKAMGIAVKRRFFIHESVGLVAGFELVDGRRVAAKAHPPMFSRRYLTASVALQHTLFDAALPVIASLGDPFAFGDRFVTLHRWLSAPSATIETDPTASAEMLRRLIAVATEAMPDDLHPHPFRRLPGERYGRPHSALFNFATTNDGADWIDAYADLAAAALDAADAPHVVGHSDWAARNVVVADGVVRAIFDLDSLCMGFEEWFVGAAALTWATTGDTGSPGLRSFDEIDEFVRAYGNADLDERMVAAAALETLAYLARCEHSLARTRWRREWARPHLRRIGPDLRVRIAPGS
jgi:hypothetical protein